MRLARKIYQRYLVRETLAAVGLVLLAFIALFAFFDFIEELRGSGVIATVPVWLCWPCYCRCPG